MDYLFLSDERDDRRFPCRMHEPSLPRKKEEAEHATIVDSIRNDLSRVATEVTVTRYRYIG